MKTVQRILLVGLAWALTSAVRAQTVYIPSGTSGIGSISGSNVGIGVSTPGYKLDVNGMIGGRDAIITSGTNGSFTAWDRNGAAHSSALYRNAGFTRLWDDVAGDVISYDSSGHVGIGTAAPASQLHVYGAAGTGAPLGSGGGTLYLQDNGGAPNNGGAIAFGASQGYWAGIKGLINNGGNNTTGDIGFFTRTNATDSTLTEKVRFTQAGRIGLGTPTPNAGLDIWNYYYPSADSLRFSYYDVPYSKWYWMGIQPYVVGAGNVGYRFRANNDTSTVEALAITGDGKLGVGSLNPVGKLEVNQANPAGWGGNPKAMRVVSPDAAYYLDLNTFVVAAGNVGYQFSPNGNSGLTITTPGNVGIGTLSPTQALDVNGIVAISGNPFASFNSNNINVQSGSNAFNIYNNLGSAPLVTVTNAGSVGIGTTNPTQKLAVNGTIRAKEVVVDTGWSDYVFDDSYRLAPLSEVEQRIKADKHLPGIPSARDVAEHGVTLGDMQAKLLAKIEELTLHQIEQEKRELAQEKRLDEQSRRLAQLEAENAELRKK